MFQFFRDIRFKYKLILCFLLIITINAFSGLMNLNSLKQVADLVYATYDKALMSGSFSQAVKYDFARYDTAIKSALLSLDYKDFQKKIALSKKTYKTLLEDLSVVEERSLSKKTKSLIQELEVQLKEVRKLQDRALIEKENLLSNNINNSHKAMELRFSWDANKVKNAVYRKLTAISDDAAEVGYEFRLSSESTSNNNISLVITVLTVTTILGILIALVVSFFVISPLIELRDICKKISEGDLTHRAPINSKDEFGDLAHAFNTMLGIIQKKDDDISALLTSLPFGLFYFDREGTISKERSSATDKIFSDFPKYKMLADFFSAHQYGTAQINGLLNVVYEGKIPFTSAANLFPKKILITAETGTKTIHLSYRPQYVSKGKVERVIVLAEDITEKLRIQEESRVLNERVQRISKVSSDSESFKEFYPAVNQLYSSVFTNAENFSVENISTIKRDLHTLKGLLGIFSFTSCAEQIHKVEDFLTDCTHEKIIKSIEMILSSQNLFKGQVTELIELLSINRNKDFKSYETKKIELVKELAVRNNLNELIKAIESLDRYPVDKVFQKYTSLTQSLMERFKDKKIHLSFDEKSDELSYEEAQQVDAALIHILRNSIDHGIEETAERIQKSKSEIGNIKISCKRSENMALEIKISDDGKGISADLLASKAVSKGIWSESESAQASVEDKLELIFKSGFSTKDQATELSGRGMGMDAVRDLIESLGGIIKLTTEVGVGTTFSFSVPLGNDKKLIN
jgi:signal transduction histidine kinase/HAMP domain-containing protein